MARFLCVVRCAADLGFLKWNPSYRDTLGTKMFVLISEVSELQRTNSMYNSLTTVGYLLEFVLGYGYLPWSVFPLLLGASTGDLSQSFSETFSVC